MAIVRQEDSPYLIMRRDNFESVCKRLGVRPEEILLRGLIGPSPQLTDMLRVRVVQQLLDMTDAELNQVWAAVTDVHDRRPPDKRPPSPGPKPQPARPINT